MTKEFIEEIEKRIDRRTTFAVSSIPIKVLKEFKDYCKEECGDIYHVGIAQLLKIKKQYEELIPLFSSLQSQIDEVKNKIDNPKKEIKTFG